MFLFLHVWDRAGWSGRGRTESKADRISIGRNGNRESFENKGDSVAERLKVIEKSMSTKESGSQIELASEETGMRPHWKIREIRSDERLKLKVIENSMSIKES